MQDRPKNAIRTQKIEKLKNSKNRGPSYLLNSTSCLLNSISCLLNDTSCLLNHTFGAPPPKFWPPSEALDTTIRKYVLRSTILDGSQQILELRPCFGMDEHPIRAVKLSIPPFESMFRDL